jgi:TolB protein
MDIKYFYVAVLLTVTGCAHAQEKQAVRPVVLLSEKNVENAYPRLSADGKSVLYQSDRTGKWQLYVFDLLTRQNTQLTNGSANNNFPDWSADNEWIAFVSDRNGNEEVYVMKRDGSNTRRLTDDPARDIHPYFSPDGKYLLFNSTRGNGSLDIYRFTLESGKTERITNTERNETCARYSTDMKFITFLGNDDVSDDICMMDMATGVTTNITGDPGIRDGWPMFSGDGKWIYYSSMQPGPFCVFRISPDGMQRQQLTYARNGEEDARAFIATNNTKLIYNKRYSDRIEICAVDLL